MFNICIADIDENGRVELSKYAQDYFAHLGAEYRIETLDCGALKATDTCCNYGYDLAIIDISDADTRLSLLKYAQLLRRWHRETKIIFTSDKLYCALDVFDYDPDYFIFKPQLEMRFNNAMEHLLGLEASTRNDSLYVGTKSSRHIIKAKSILYMEHYQHNTKIVCEDKEVICHEKLSTLLGRLNDSQFVRCHCSFAVNLRHVRNFSRVQLTMSNGDLIPCSRNNQKTVKDALSRIHEVKPVLPAGV